MIDNDTFILIRSARRTMALEIKPNAELVVRVPLGTPLAQARRFIARHREWIKKKQAAALSRPRLQPREFADGEEFPLLGQSYRLRVVEKLSEDIDWDGQLRLAASALPRAREIITKWYKEKARQVLTERVEHYSGIMGCCPSVIRITSPRKRWGSCGAGGSVNFNWKLIMAPLEVIDYLVVHELAHLWHRGHGRDFWGMVSLHIPEYKQRQKWLKKNGYLLEL